MQRPFRKQSAYPSRLLILAIVVVLMLGSIQASSAANAVVRSVSADEFLSSLGVCIHVDQGVPGGTYITPLRYLGVRNLRDQARHWPQFIMLHRATGVRLALNAEGDLEHTISIAKSLAASDALMALDGPNEPNNFPITYKGQTGGSMGSWVPVAEFQRDLYQAVKNDRDLREYPIFAVSESGAEIDNVGLQFLRIPPGAGTILPAETQYADYANTHNYVSSNEKMYRDNQAWNAADPIPPGPWDGLSGNYGVTWRHNFRGYSSNELLTLPRVTTETGWDSVSGIGGERIQGTVLVNTYLAQFKRGWRYTFIYQLRDGEGGLDNQGLFHSDSTPKLSATYIHSLTSILADLTPIAFPGSLTYSIVNQPSTVHDLLIQKSSGTFELVIWDENVSGTDNVAINFDRNHAHVNIYDVTAGTTPTQILNNIGSVSLNLSDHAMVIEIIN
jgi:hypothetical protein